MRVLGLRVKTGFAIGVIVAGTRSSFRIERRVHLPLTEGRGKYARFPFHPLIELSGDGAVATSHAAVAQVETSAARLMRAALVELGALHRATLVCGSLLDPVKIGNPHMRVHAQEGSLYRTVLAKALTEAGIAHDCFEEKAVRSVAAAALNLNETEALDTVTQAGRGMIKPWRVDEKAAVLSALPTLPV